MSKSTLYKYFAGKDAVLMALINSLCDQTEAELASAESAQDIVGVAAAHAMRLPRSVILQPSKMPKASRVRLQKVQGSLVEHSTGFMSRVAAVSLAAACFAVMEDAARTGDARGDTVHKVMDCFSGS